MGASREPTPPISWFVVEWDKERPLSRPTLIPGHARRLIGTCRSGRRFVPALQALEQRLHPPATGELRARGRDGHPRFVGGDSTLKRPAGGT